MEKNGQARGFAVSIDALLATIVTLAVLAFAGIGIQSSLETTAPFTVNIKEAAEDAFLALDNTGMLTTSLVDEESTNPAETILEAAKDILPGNIELMIEVKEFKANLGAGSECRTSQDFESCFGTEPADAFEAGEIIPGNKEIVHGRRLLVTKSLGADEETGMKCTIVEESFAGEEEKPKAMLQEGPEKSVETEVIATSALPASEANKLELLECCEDPENPGANEKAVVTMKIRDSSREPVSIMLLMDRSDSMGNTTEDFDIKPKEGSFTVSGLGECLDSWPDGNTVGCTRASTNCPPTNFSWSDPKWGVQNNVANFEINQAFVDNYFGIFENPNGASLEIWARRSGTWDWTCNYSGLCSAVVSGWGTTYYSVERLKVRDPQLTMSYGGNDCHVGISRGNILTRLPFGTTWRVDAWSAVPTVVDIYERINSGQQNLPNAQLQGIGTHSGSGSECANFEGWELLGEKTITALELSSFIGAITYTGYSGDCAPRFKTVIKETVVTLNETKCGTPNSTFCTSGEEWITFAPPSMTFQIWGWSDAPLTVTPGYSMHMLIGQLKDDIEIKGNCVEYEGDSTCRIVKEDTCVNPSETSWETIDTFNVDSYLSAFRVWACVQRSTGCSYSRVRLKDPSGNVVWYDSSSAKEKGHTCGGTATCRDCGIKTILGSGSPPTIQEGDWVLEGWTDQPGIAAATWYIKRIDAARKAAKTFIDNAQWKDEDLIGLVSYANDTKFHPPGLTTDREAVKTAMNTLATAGQTAIADAINTATAGLTGEGSEHLSKFMILLTDGRTNVCLDGIPCPEADAKLDAVNKADEARAAGITIYTIGFAAQESSLDICNLKQIAKDPETLASWSPVSCTGNQAAGEIACDADPNSYCGEYYYAADEDALQEIYEKIASEIKAMFGKVDVEAPFPEGMELLPLLSGQPVIGKYGVWDDSLGGTGLGGWVGTPEDIEAASWSEAGRTLSVNDQVINYFKTQWFAMQFEVVLPCGGTYCLKDYVLFPPSRGGGEVARIVDDDGFEKIWAAEAETAEDLYCSPNDPENPNCNGKYLKLPFKYRDLKLRFTGGKVETDGVLLDLNVANVGYKGVAPEKQIDIVFYEDETPLAADCALGSCDLVGSETNNGIELTGGSVWAGSLHVSDLTLCATKPAGASCIYSTAEDTEANVKDIFFTPTGSFRVRAEIVPLTQDSVNECSEHNNAWIYCGVPEFRFFTIDYYAWVK